MTQTLQKDAPSDLHHRPPIDPEVVWPEPPVPLTHKLLRRPVKRALLWFIDRGWFGYKPLETHVVIAGFPRGGTTLVQAIFEACVDDALTFGQETRGLTQARYAIRSSALMITKRPDDLFQFDEIREYYRGRRAKVQFLLVARDPRAVLTSRHEVNRDHYYVSPQRWRCAYQHWRYQAAKPDMVSIRFEELVTHPDQAQAMFTEKLGLTFKTPITEFHKVLPKTFDARALNGVRPLDPKMVGRWRDEKHRQRLTEILRELPELPQALIEMGYETDTQWANEYA